jgi:hypothetical protein
MNPEELARQKIDRLLSRAGWCVLDRREIKMIGPWYLLYNYISSGTCGQASHNSHTSRLHLLINHTNIYLSQKESDYFSLIKCVQIFV